MKDAVGVWIDHTKAVIASASADGVKTEVIESHVEGHPRYSGHEDEGEKKYEERHRQRLESYYDEVIRRLGDPDRLLIFGPGEAKLQLRDRVLRSASSAKRVIDIDTADKLTDAQIVGKVKAHFGLDR
jgi:hypothetical protein